MRRILLSCLVLIAVLGSAVEAKAPSYPKFELYSMEGSLYSSLKLRGRAVLIAFFARPCLPCRMEVPFFNELHARYPDTLSILGIAFMENDFDMLKSLVGEWGIKYAVIPDGDGKVSRAFENVIFPCSFLMDHTGKVIATYQGLGEVNNRAMIQQLTALQPKIKEYRAKGPTFFVGDFKESDQGAQGMGKIWQSRITSWLSAEGATINPKKDRADYVISGNISSAADTTRIELIFSNSGGIEEFKFRNNLKKGEESKLRQQFVEKLKGIPYAIKRH